MYSGADYSQRNSDGSVGKIPDSLMTEYKTRNGRIVKDGGGILPDILIEKDNFNQIVPPYIVKDYFLIMRHYTTIM